MGGLVIKPFSDSKGFSMGTELVAVLELAGAQMLTTNSSVGGSAY